MGTLPYSPNNKQFLNSESGVTLFQPHTMSVATQSMKDPHDLAINKIISESSHNLDFTSLFNHPKFISGYISKYDRLINHRERRMQELKNTLTTVKQKKPRIEPQHPWKQQYKPVGSESPNMSKLLKARNSTDEKVADSPAHRSSLVSVAEPLKNTELSIKKQISKNSSIRSLNDSPRKS